MGQGHLALYLLKRSLQQSYYSKVRSIFKKHFVFHHYIQFLISIEHHKPEETVVEVTVWVLWTLRSLTQEKAFFNPIYHFLKVINRENLWITKIFFGTLPLIILDYLPVRNSFRKAPESTPASPMKVTFSWFIGFPFFCLCHCLSPLSSRLSRETQMRNWFSPFTRLVSSSRRSCRLWNTTLGGKLYIIVVK